MENGLVLAVVGSVPTVVLGQMIQRFVLEPIQEYKKVIGKIDNRLKYFKNIIANSGSKEEFVSEARKILRELSCDLEAAYKQIPFRSNMIWFLPTQANLADAARRLIYLSNAGGESGGEVRNDTAIRKIRDILSIPEL